MEFHGNAAEHLCGCHGGFIRPGKGKKYLQKGEERQWTVCDNLYYEHQARHPSFEAPLGQTKSLQQKLSLGHCSMVSTDARNIYRNPGD